ncbi:hypothetical protein [Acidiphilium sp.]|uniref:hypothetical protein n=1 Tax=Acidiphilium sp. TaxID=527 RepID=UPI003D03D0FD
MSETTVTVVGGNLFAIAAQYLGDATQWIRIAQINNMNDPVLDGVVTLIMPPVDVSATGGVPSV